MVKIKRDGWWYDVVKGVDMIRGVEVEVLVRVSEEENKRRLIEDEELEKWVENEMREGR